VVLPAGEVATYPVSVTGTLVADLAVHANVPIDRDSRLHHSPLTVEIVDGDAVELRCDDHDMLALVAGWFRQPWGTRVGELGFGTNLGVTQSVANNSHVNERSPGVHLGFGHHHQGRDRVGYDTDIHVDLIAQGGVVEVSGHRIDLRAPIEPTAGWSVGGLEVDGEDIISASAD
jgi:leucyl aminopeptidase (aminopeptidase T)